jgi:4-amino-4-deoxy-L-arabinose transferase-like glycosyltransferase
MGSTSRSEDGPGWRAAVGPAVLCLAVNLAVFAAVAVNRPDYLRDYRTNHNPDALHYVLLGRNLLLHGEYSRCDGPPFVPDMVRTPVYPVFAGGLDLLGGAGAIYLAQALLQTGSCLLLFALVRPRFGVRAAFWASLLLATDLMLAIYNFEAMSEPLFNFLALAGLALAVPAVLSLTGEGCGAGRLFFGGLLLGLAILTRPTGLYLPVVLALSLLGLGLWRKRFARALAGTLALLLGACPFPALWIARNATVFSVPRLSTTDAVVRVYFLGGGAYQLHHQIPLEEAQAKIAREFGLPPHEVVMNPWVSDQPISELDVRVRSAAFPVMTKYPAELVKSALGGLIKASVSHNTGELAGLTGKEWQAPGLGDLFRLRPAALARLWANGPVLALVFGWQGLHVLLTLGLAAGGVVVGLRRPSTRAVTGLILAVLLYFYLTVAVFGLEAFYRCRVPVLPFLCALAGVGLAGALRLGRRIPARPSCPVRAEVAL